MGREGGKAAGGELEAVEKRWRQNCRVVLIEAISSCRCVCICVLCVLVCGMCVCVCARVAACSCRRPRAKCLSNYFAQLSAGWLRHASSFCPNKQREKKNAEEAGAEEKKWERSRRTTAASLTVCLCLSNWQQQQGQARQQHGATRQQHSTAAAASVNKGSRVGGGKRKNRCGN